jgi:hypothetical protein
LAFGRSIDGLGRDAVVFEHPGLLRARGVHTAHAVLLPRQRHGGAVDGQVDVVPDRTLFDLGPLRARRAANNTEHLFDNQLDVRAAPFVAQYWTSLRPTRAARISVGWTRTKVLLAFWVTPQA